jgi:hypothetical protein
MAVARRALLSLAALLALAPTGLASAATLKADYDFQGTRASSVAGAPALTDAGPGTNAFQTDTVLGNQQQVLTFPKDNGLALTSTNSIISSGSYSVVMLVRLDQIGGYRRLIDFTDGMVDNGFYALGGQLVLYPAATGNSAGLVPANTYVQIALTRDAAGTVNGYINRTLALGPYDDSRAADAAITSSNILRFFIDDTAVPGEDSAGAVARIRIYDGPLTAAEVAALAPTLPPVQGKAVDVGAVSGKVLVKLPGQAAFQLLSGSEQIPVGATVDATLGRVRLTSAVDTHGKTQSADFYSGGFRLTQKRGQALTALQLVGGHSSACPHAASADLGPVAIAARRHPRRRLWGSGRGSYATSGSTASATVRGTTWLTEDFCEGTLVSVRRGTVVVRDFVRHRTIIVHAPHSYFAAQKR